MKNTPLFTVLFALFALGAVSCALQTKTDEPIKEAVQNVSDHSKQEKPMFQDLSPEQFKAKYEASSNAVLLDVRTPQEVSEGNIEGNTNINRFDADFAQQVEKLDKSKTYFVYCRSGKRSADACQVMAKLGFKELYNLDGGYMAWEVAF